MSRWMEKILQNQDRRSDAPKTSRQKAKAFLQFKIILKREIINAFLILAGIISASFGLKSFLLPNDFIDGGITGVSLLVSAVTNWNLSYLIVILNIPFILLGLTQISRNFVIKTALGILGLALSLALLHFPTLTADKLLVSVFGGFFLGAGI